MYLLHFTLVFVFQHLHVSLISSCSSLSRIKVLRLNQSTIAELHSYIKPPDEVSTVMRATFLLLGHSEKEIQVICSIQSISFVVNDILGMASNSEFIGTIWQR